MSSCNKPPVKSVFGAESESGVKQSRAPATSRNNIFYQAQGTGTDGSSSLVNAPLNVSISQLDETSDFSSHNPYVLKSGGRLYSQHSAVLSPAHSSDTLKIKQHKSAGLCATPVIKTNKIFALTIHSAKVQISSSINLRFACQLNGSEIYQTQVKRVDQQTRVANF